MTTVPNIMLSDGNQMPQLGFGVWQVPNDEVGDAVRHAIDVGYRSIDTAKIYKNEKGTGEAIAGASVPREELFITTKLWNADHGYESGIRACNESLKRMGLDYFDLYLIHWPVPSRDLYVDAWKALVALQQEGRVRSIGVSNFLPHHLERIIAETGVTPAVNQVELHPNYQQAAARAFHSEHGIVTEAYSPLGSGRLLGDELIAGIASKHGKSPAQVMIRWSLQLGNIVIPKSVTPKRIDENLDVFGFELDADDMAAIGSLDDPENGKFGANPDEFAWMG